MVQQSARRYKIIYIIDGLGMGGAERLMIPILEKLDRDVFEPRVCVFHVINRNPVADAIQASGVAVDLLPVPYMRDISAIPRLYRYLKEKQADLVHTQLELANIMGNAVAKLLKLPSVCTIHTIPSQEMKLKSKLHQEVELLSLRLFCDHVISVSEGARQFHLSINKVSSEKVSTIYNGIDLVNFVKTDRQAERGHVRKELGIPETANILATVAVLRPLKGIQFMIRAMPAILAKYPNVYYLIVGSGTYEETLLKELDVVGVKEHVIFAGMRSDIPRILAASDIFVLPTLTEALPTVLAEAMAAKLPIVASKVGGVPEMIRDGENGYLVAPEDSDGLAQACIRLLSDPQKSATMGTEGWEIVNKKFNIERQVGQLKKLYLDLLQAYGK